MDAPDDIGCLLAVDDIGRLILSKLSFAMEGRHRRLKRMLRHGCLSLLRGRLGVQFVIDSHTIDDSLRREGWDVKIVHLCTHICTIFCSPFKSSLTGGLQGYIQYCWASYVVKFS